MKRFTYAALAMAVLAATPALAAPDSVRLQLAREVFEANGGVKAAQAQIDSMLVGMQRMMKSTVPSGAVSDRFTAAMRAQMLKMMGPMMEDVAVAYAEGLTEAELRDMLAWARSPSAQSINAKLPGIMQGVMAKQGPRMLEMMAGIKTAAVEEVCLEAKCTPAQRAELVAAFDKAMPAKR